MRSFQEAGRHCVLTEGSDERNETGNTTGSTLSRKVLVKGTKKLITYGEFCIMNREFPINDIDIKSL